MQRDFAQHLCLVAGAAELWQRRPALQQALPAELKLAATARQKRCAAEEGHTLRRTRRTRMMEQMVSTLLFSALKSARLRLNEKQLTVWKFLAYWLKLCWALHSAAALSLVALVALVGIAGCCDQELAALGSAHLLLLAAPAAAAVWVLQERAVPSVQLLAQMWTRAGAVNWSPQMCLQLSAREMLTRGCAALVL